MTKMQARLGQWFIDTNIDLSAACERGQWHLASVVDELVTDGLARTDAEAFANFAFAAVATTSDRTAEECVTAEQYDRLTTD